VRDRQRGRGRSWLRHGHHCLHIDYQYLIYRITSNHAALPNNSGLPNKSEFCPTIISAPIL
jgi:hypothetical protein